MILDPASASHLKPWLIRTLEPICDAEPGALADYILALLKHTVPESEMRKELAVQLDEFLEKECSSFINTLFTVLRTKSYLPYSATPSSPSFSSKTLDTGIPIPLDGLLSPSEPTSPQRGHKRSIENDERDGRPPAKGPRLSTDGQFSRYGNGHGGRQDGKLIGGWAERSGGARQQGNGFTDSAFDGFGGGMANMGMNIMGAMGLGLGGMPGMNGAMGQMNGRRSQAYQPPGQKRGICRDYHNNGYCARGAMCKYSHGDDAVIPGQLYSMPSMSSLPFMPMFPGGVSFGGGPTGAAYDPHESRMDMRPMPGRPHNRAPVLPRIQQEDGSRVLHSIHVSGELPVIQDLTPTLPPDPLVPTTEQSASDVKSIPTDQLPQPIPIEHGGTERNAYSQHESTQSFMNASPDVEMASPVDKTSPMRHQNGGFRGGPRGAARGRGGIFGGEVHNFRPERRKDKTLVVEKIPEDKLSLEHVNGWFKKFGTVTNVAIDSSNAKALVSFLTHDEAHAAWKSEDAVFNNRFVKIFWHRPMEGHGQVGARMLAASAPLVANYTTQGSPKRSLTSLPTAPANAASSSRKPMASSAAAALAAKQQLLEQQIAEQKSLMASLSTASPDEKKEIMARLRKLGDEIKSVTITPTPLRPAVTLKKVANATNLSDHEQKERERLDKELELHHVTASAVGDEENSEDLKAKLDRLKAEAASLGITEAAGESSHPNGAGAYRPYRGRARGGRSLYRGAVRGGPPRASMKLDNRPKKLLVKAVHEDSLRALRDWYETTNQVDSFEALDGGDVVVSFKSRAAAEQGLAQGTNVPTIGPLQISWFTGKQPNATSTLKTPLVTKEVGVSEIPPAATRLRSPEPPLLHSPHTQEEEIEASGWGGDGEDGMGML